MDILIQLFKTNINTEQVARLAIVLGHDIETFNKRFRKTTIINTQKYIDAKNKYMYYVLPDNSIKKLDNRQIGFFGLFKKEYILKAINTFCIEKDYTFSLNDIMNGNFLQIELVDLLKCFPYEGMTYLFKYCLAFSLNLLDDDMDETEERYELDEYIQIVDLGRDSKFMDYYL